MKKNENKSLSKSQNSKHEKNKNLKKLVKSNSCIRLTSTQKKAINKNEVNKSNGNKLNRISK